MRISTILLSGAALALAACDTFVEPIGPVAVGPVAPTSVTTANKAPYGTYLVDGAGRALYILEGERGGVTRCTPDCLAVWPPLHPAGPPVAGAGVDPARLATVPMHGRPHVTYAGWPLYYYVRDRAPGDTTGQHVTDRWGTWHLMSPSGQPIRPAGSAAY